MGGRVHTIRAPFSDSLHGEAGAEYISGGHVHVQELLRRFSLLTGRAPGAPRMYSFLSRTVEGTSAARLGPEVAADLRRLGRQAAALGRRVPDPVHPWDAPDAVDLDARSVRAWLDGLCLNPVTDAYLNVWHRLDYSIENSTLSLLQYARDDALYRSESGRSAGRPREGMDALPRAMAASLGERVRLGAELTGVEQDTTCVTLTLRQGDRAITLRARRVILAVPASTLCRIPIAPALPPRQQQAVAGLRYGTVVKVLMQFRRRFWLEGRRIRGVMTDHPFLSAWDATRDQPGERGILGTYTAGSNGRELAAMDSDARITWCLAQLEQVFPGAGELFEVGYAAVWDREPFTRGTYSYYAPREMTRFGPHLATPYGRIHFAGEHTDPWQATMNGALASGVRAAEEVMAAG